MLGGTSTETTTAAPATPAARTLALVDRTWDRVVAAPGLRFGVLLTAFVVLRAGIMAHADTAASLRLVDAFPHLPVDFRSNSIIGPLLGWALGIDDRSTWLQLNAVLVVAAVAVALACLRARFPDVAPRRMATTWLALGSLPPVILQKVGGYDVYTLAGSFLVVLAPTPALAGLGGVLIGATSAEQGLVGLLAAAAVAVALSGRTGEGRDGWRAGAQGLLRTALGRNLVAGVVGTLLARLAVLVAFAVWDVQVPSRFDVFGEFLGPALSNAWGAGLGGVYAWLGIAWAVLGLLWLAGDGDLRRWLVVVGLLIGPAAAVTVTTHDGTRVFAMASLPALLVVLGWVVDRVHDAERPDLRRLAARVTGTALLLSPLLPALVTDPSGLTFYRFAWSYTQP